MANSVSLTGFVEGRNEEPFSKPVWEQEVIFVVEAGGGHAEQTYTVLVNGILQEAVIEVGAAGGITGTVNVDFDDNNGVEFSANASLGEGSETILSFSKPVNNFIIRADASDDPTTGQADWLIKITCRGI